MAFFAKRRKRETAQRSAPPELLAEAEQYPGGWVYEIDADLIEDGPYGAVPFGAIIGGWQVDKRGRLTGVFWENPNYEGKG